MDSQNIDPSLRALAALHNLLPEALREPWIEMLIGLALLLLVAGAAHLGSRFWFVRLVGAAVKRTSTTVDDVLFDSRFMSRLALLVPFVLIQIGIGWVPHLGTGAQDLVVRGCGAILALLIARSLSSLLQGLHLLYQRMPQAANRPIKSYIQLAQLFVYCIAAIFVVARLVNQSPWFLVSGLGAAMAIILLIFRDTLLSLVASVQLTNNDLVRVGDWIEMPQFGADGYVVDIALNTVRVQNWDRTVTVVPTHKFLENSFKNWRQMFEGGGRRIKRSIFINMSSVRFLREEEIERFSRFALLAEYMEGKKQELREANAQFEEEPELIVNTRRLTNVGTFRAYVSAYLRKHPMINQDLTFLVRQLAPTAEGLPLEIYVFVSDTRWAVYEGVQADIFDHLLAIAPEFGLMVYQRPSGKDFQQAMLDEAAYSGEAA